ncbi:MAG: Asp-tRNA(Asn)/Glu-tRNA(Gln) amidotransferase subunit GatA [Kofleriaceae bacterium]|nr:Asp-tRNA(Asn)/Glu-tRNA(Gln) amidotransferase subunit GatA [Kofleriaceae bacterium]
MSAELAYAGAAELARRVRAREVSAVELTDAFLARIDAHDGALGAYLAVDHEGARNRALIVDAMIAAGQDPGPLAGVPVGVKDVIVTEGLVTTAASRILDGWVPPYDATAVARLRAAGAVVLGKLNCDEFAMGSSNERSGYRPCQNPWDLERVPGGSSGGSAAAVAAGLAAATLGTDTGGSIRQPAAFCGVVGLKPTYGRVSRWGAIAFASSLDQIGPLGGSVEDCALLLEVIAGADPRDATSIDQPVPSLRPALTAGVAGLKVGLPREYFEGALDPEVAAAVRAAGDALVAAGAELREVTLPHTRFALPAYYVVAPAEAASNLARYDGVRFGHRGGGRELAEMYATTRAEGFGPEVKRRIMIGTYALRAGHYEAYYRKAQQVRALIKRDFDQAFEEVDVLLTPTTPTAAFARGEKAAPLDMYLADVFTLACNLAGIPGLALPVGATASGLPIGAQLLGRALDEVTLVRAGAELERAFGTRRPPAYAGAA